MPKLRHSRGLPIEQVAHVDLTDMPDIAGTNSDHDARYYTQAQLNSIIAPSGASLIGVEDAGGFFAGADVEAVLQEIMAALLPGAYLRLDGTNAPTANYNWTTNLTTTGNLTTAQLNSDNYYANNGTTLLFSYGVTGITCSENFLPDSPLNLGGGASPWTNIYATNIIIGANTLNTTEWANLDGQNQTVATTSAPTFTGLTLNGKITTYNSVATEGYGVSAIVAYVGLTNQGADVSANFSNAGTAGFYRLSYYLECTTADATAGTVKSTITWTDDVGGTMRSSTALSLTSLDRILGAQFPIQLASGNIAYSTSHTGIYGTAKYALYYILERLN